MKEYTLQLSCCLSQSMNTWQMPAVRFCMFNSPPVWDSSSAQRSSWTPCRCVRQWPGRHCRCCAARKPLCSWGPLGCDLRWPASGFCCRPELSWGSRSRWRQQVRRGLSRCFLLGDDKKSLAWVKDVKVLLRYVGLNTYYIKKKKNPAFKMHIMWFFSQKTVCTSCNIV